MNNKTRVVPAIQTDKPAELERKLKLSAAFTHYVQIDIMDGQFVPSTSISWEDIERARPRLRWEVHLMVKDPARVLLSYQRAGAFRAIFHFEAAGDPESVIASARALGLEVGLAINPETAVPQVLPLLDRLDSILVMSVHPGFYGAKFLPEVLSKVREIKAARPRLEVGIDGGIKETNILEVASSGLDAICVGSAIFLQSDPAASYRRLQSLAEGASKTPLQ